MFERMKRTRKLAVIGMALLLGACQTPPKISNEGLETFVHDDFVSQYQERLERDAWRLKGAFSFSNQEESVQGKVLWDQSKLKTNIELSGPLGAGAVLLNLEPDSASLQKGKKTYQAKSADELMLGILGWKMPIQSLTYWMYGLADPAQKAQYRSDEKGGVAELRQNGWSIRFKQYREVEGFSVLMPRKIFASHEKTGTNVKLVVKKMSQ